MDQDKCQLCLIPYLPWFVKLHPLYVLRRQSCDPQCYQNVTVIHKTWYIALVCWCFMYAYCRVFFSCTVEWLARRTCNLVLVWPEFEPCQDHLGCSFSEKLDLPCIVFWLLSEHSFRNWTRYELSLNTAEIIILWIKITQEKKTLTRSRGQ